LGKEERLAPPVRWQNSQRLDDERPKTEPSPVEDGCINPHGCGHYMIVHTQQWSDFVLTLDFKISKSCNSGIFVRTASLTPRPGKDVGFNGIEVQIWIRPPLLITTPERFMICRSRRRTP
jgi:hypothetical protein